MGKDGGDGEWYLDFEYALRGHDVRRALVH
jgi:hypothetical protein